MRALSLFGGFGLFDLGFRKAGFSVVRAADFLWYEDIRDFDPTPYRNIFDVVFGGVPCHPWAKTVFNKNRHQYIDLFPEFYNIIKIIQPHIFIIENVPDAKHIGVYHAYQIIPTYHTIAETFDFSKWGSAQQRKRVIFIGGLNYDLVKQIYNSLLQEIEKPIGERLGDEWRKSCGLSIVKQPHWKTITGDAFQFDRKNGHKRLTKKEIIDAFDLPPNYFDLIDRSTGGSHPFRRDDIFSRITQGVPIAASYTIGKTVYNTLKQKEANNGKA